MLTVTGSPIPARSGVTERVGSISNGEERTIEPAVKRIVLSGPIVVGGTIRLLDADPSAPVVMGGRSTILPPGRRQLMATLELAGKPDNVYGIASPTDP